MSDQTCNQAAKLRVVILGSGNIGTDLLMKTRRSPVLECVLFAGRNLSSPGMTKASSLGVRISDRGIDAVLDEAAGWDLMFDATSAIDHVHHWSLLEKLGKMVIDMTPSRVGAICIPAINLADCLNQPNVNMITCGGQASMPLAYLIGQTHPQVDYVEVVSSIASRSAGPATRLNLDEYVDTTSGALAYFSGCPKTKAILILNPANPCINMQTTVFAKVKQPNLDALKPLVAAMVTKIQGYVPGYQLLVPPTFENGRIVIMVKVEGLGDYLPRYAGNLDIINCAAIAAAEEYAKKKLAPAGPAPDENCAADGDYSSTHNT
ncbi:MAG: acetaldehyde dehydrogenase (acetylating) [Deltaproteobacteria bacterium]|nr:acetaldehyde dehydrogenase (acetylating) [Deltaproteobacteria bacterium]